MENQTQQNELLTKANEPQETVKGVILSEKEVEEYRNFQRRKRIDEIMSAMFKSGSVIKGTEGTQQICDQAKSLKQASLQLPCSQLATTKRCLFGDRKLYKNRRMVKAQDFWRLRKNSPKTHIDCLIGGTGETTLAVKMYEARRAVQGGAKELTFILTPSLILNGKYA